MLAHTRKIWDNYFWTNVPWKTELGRTSAIVRIFINMQWWKFEYNLDAWHWQSTTRNSGKNYWREFTLPPPAIPTQLAFKNSAPWPFASTFALICTVCLTLSLQLISDEVVLPLSTEENVSPTIWNLCPASGIENDFLSNKSNCALWSYCALHCLIGITWPSCCCLSGSGNRPPHRCPCPSLTTSISKKDLGGYHD